MSQKVIHEHIKVVLDVARDKGIVIAAFTDDAGMLIVLPVDHLINVPSTVTARIQEMHITLCHLLCETLEKRRGLA